MRYRQSCGKLLPAEAEAKHVRTSRVVKEGETVIVLEGCCVCRNRPLLTPEDKGVKWWTPRVGHIRPEFALA